MATTKQLLIANLLIWPLFAASNADAGSRGLVLGPRPGPAPAHPTTDVMSGQLPLKHQLTRVLRLDVEPGLVVGANGRRCNQVLGWVAGVSASLWNDMLGFHVVYQRHTDDLEQHRSMYVGISIGPRLKDILGPMLKTLARRISGAGFGVLRPLARNTVEVSR